MSVSRIERARACALIACVAASLIGCGGPPEGTTVRASSRASAAPPAARSKQLVPPWPGATAASAPPREAPPSPVTPEPTPAGRRVLETAMRMVGESVVVRGSCYRYIDTVFDNAGYSGWRRRTTVFRSSPNGPYADLDLVQPGDWLWIVNHPELDPVGTHSVLFVEWIDREEGYARVVSYVGGGQDRPADDVGYDVSRTYGIQRAVDAPEPPRRRRARRR